ncbi:MAG: exosortase K [Polyangiales bacterium]
MLTFDRKRLYDAGAIAVMLGIAYALKRHYSSADAEALAWILAPTAWLVEALVGTPFVSERGVGYVNNGLRFAIAPSCAGVNFMIVAICAATLGFVGQRRTLFGKIGFVLGSVPAAYVLALTTNTLRITIALFLQEHPLRLDALSSAQVHHAGGVVIYFACLCLFYVIAERVTARVLST